MITVRQQWHMSAYGTEETIHLSRQIVGLLGRSRPSRASLRAPQQGVADPRCQPIGIHQGKAYPERLRAPCGNSIPEFAGGVKRWFGEGLLTGHHFRKQPPGDRSERETVMGMAKGEP